MKLKQLPLKSSAKGHLALASSFLTSFMDNGEKKKNNKNRNRVFIWLHIISWRKKIQDQADMIGAQKPGSRHHPRRQAVPSRMYPFCSSRAKHGLCFETKWPGRHFCFGHLGKDHSHCCAEGPINHPPALGLNFQATLSEARHLRRTLLTLSWEQAEVRLW